MLRVSGPRFADKHRRFGCSSIAREVPRYNKRALAPPKTGFQVVLNTTFQIQSRPNPKRYVMQKTPPYVAASVALALAAFASFGCRQPVANDATTTAAVQTRIAGDAALGSEPIQASVQAGIATLNGTVSNEAARSLAANDAAAVAGVKTVVNNLTVQSAAVAPAPQLAPAAAPAVVSTPPTRVRTLPTKPTAAVERQRISNNVPPPQAPAAVAVERPAPYQPPPPAAPSFRNISVPAGTSIPVRITQTLDSATAQAGQTFSGTVASDVLVEGAVAIPQGSAVSGRVDAVQEAAHFKGNSLLTIELTSITRRGGQNIPVSTEAFSKEGAGRGKNTAVKTGAGAAAGAILGGIFGGGKGAAIGAAAGGGTGAGINAVTRGQQVQIPSESLISFRLSNSVMVRVRNGNDGNRTYDSNMDSNDSQRRPLPPQ